MALTRYDPCLLVGSDPSTGISPSQTGIDDRRCGRKKSVIALAHKMLRTIYATLSSGTHYEDRTVDYEAMSVARNAPRWIKMLKKHGFIGQTATA